MPKDIMEVSLAFEEKMTKRYEKHMRDFEKVFKEEWKKSKMKEKFEAADEDALEAYHDLYSLVTTGGC